MIFAACNQDVNTALDAQANRAITFNFSVASTRTAMADDYTTNFVDEDEVGVLQRKTHLPKRYIPILLIAMMEQTGMP